MCMNYGFPDHSFDLFVAKALAKGWTPLRTAAAWEWLRARETVIRERRLAEISAEAKRRAEFLTAVRRHLPTPEATAESPIQPHPYSFL